MPVGHIWGNNQVVQIPLTMPISNTIFDHPSVAKQITDKLGIIKNRLCVAEGNESGGLTGKDGGCQMSVGSSGLINRFLGTNIINRYSLDYDVTITRGPYGEKKCYDVDITWRFSDHVELKDAEDALVPERIGHHYQNLITKADFKIEAKKKETRTICCCK
jgi:hypothetical protein